MVLTTEQAKELVAWVEQEKISLQSLKGLTTTLGNLDRRNKKEVLNHLLTQEPEQIWESYSIEKEALSKRDSPTV